MTSVDMRPDWNDWLPSQPIEILRPEEEYEGIQYPISKSTHGSATEVQELRDPCIFAENGKVYLYYSVTGEMGIAGAEIKFHHAGKSNPGR